jgi:hypothetical protein
MMTMTQETACLELLQGLGALRESVSDLLRLVTEDRPYEHSLAHRYEHAASEVLGRLDAALEAATAFRRSWEQFDYGQAMGALATCNAEFNLAAEKINGELKSFEWLQDLHMLGSEHPDEWQGWATSIEGTLNQCDSMRVYQAFSAGWQSLLISTGGVATRNIKSVGQPIFSPTSQVSNPVATT